MKVALVHDYLNDFGGAERVLKTLIEMYPQAPIYTAFVMPGSEAAKTFSGKIIRESVYAPLIKRWRLHSVLRFLLPTIWGSMDLSGFDLVITSTSSYIARGFKKGKRTKVVAYCHTPPRFLYGYNTPTQYQRYWWGRLYGGIVNPFLRYFDFKSAQEVDLWVANSENVKKRIEKYYRRKAQVVYPPVEVEKFVEGSRDIKKQDYYLIVSRLVGAKGLEEAVPAAENLGFQLKVVGAGAMKMLRGDRYVEWAGWVSDEELIKLYAAARGFIALAKDEDFGMAVVEAMAAGTPVIAYRGGGFLETVKEGETGVFVENTDFTSLKKAMEKLEKTKWEKKTMQNWVKRFSRESFEKGMRKAVENARVT